MGVDCGDRAQLVSLMLAWARRSNAEGTVLFSSHDRERLRANATPTCPTPPVTDRLAALVVSERTVDGITSFR